MKDCEHGGEHGEDDKRAGEVDTTEEHLGHPNSSLDFLDNRVSGGSAW